MQPRPALSAPTRHPFGSRRGAFSAANGFHKALVALLLGALSGVASVHAHAATEPASAARNPYAALAGAKVLVFSKTRGFRHGSIPQGIATMGQLSAEHGFEITATENSAVFTENGLRRFDAVMFLCTTGDVLDDAQQVAMERYIQGGGGYVGVHSATDTEWRGDWTWYRRLAGGVFKSHPQIQNARLTVLIPDHPATAGLPETFWHTDEWYDFDDLFDGRIDLLTVDETTYQNGRHGDYHPIAWYHDYDGGRSFYTGLGHTEASYSSPQMRVHLLGGLLYATGRHAPAGS